MVGNFYIVATPIGNLEDITLRAIRILGEVDFVFAEDTRTTSNLFDRHNIRVKNDEGVSRLISYNSVNQQEKNKLIIKFLDEGKNVALVSDAGTPGISDPGYSAVNEVRKYFEVFVDKPKIIPIPGASALTSFVSVLGLGTHAWTFFGFLPHKNGRQKMIKNALLNENSSIFYESTHRIEKCLEEIIKINNSLEKNKNKIRKVAIGKELTKIFEEIIIGTPEEVLKVFKSDPQKKKGEFVVMIV